MRLISGNPWSGQIGPTRGIFIQTDRQNSGSIVIGFSGGMTVRSGGFPLSGGGVVDGIPLFANQSVFIPKTLLRGVSSGAGGIGSGVAALYSGNPWNIFILGDAAVSGQAVIYWESDYTRIT